MASTITGDSESESHMNIPARVHAPWFRKAWLAGYPVVLLLICASYLFTAMQKTAAPSAVALLIQLVTVAAVFHAARVRRSTQRMTWWVLGASILALLVVLIGGFTGQGVNTTLATVAALAYLVTPAVILASEARRHRADGQTLLAAICAYILIGMFFTYFYDSVVLWSSASIFEGGEGDGLSNLLFFSFTTLTTTGYGNLVPATAAVQSIAIAEAVAGQLFLVTAVARVVTGWKPSPRP